MTIKRYFDQSELLILVNGSHFDGCIFDDCEIVGDIAVLKDISFLRCEFKGRAAAWFNDYLNSSGGLLMTVNIKTGEIIPGPASDKDPSFPGHLRRN